MAYRPGITASFLCATILFACSAGCNRSHYRKRADADTHAILGQKTACTPWTPPAGYDLRPDPRSRLYDPTCTDCPCLPIPAPQLYAYVLPELQRTGYSQIGSETQDKASTANEHTESNAQAGIFRLPLIKPVTEAGTSDEASQLSQDAPAGLFRFPPIEPPAGPEDGSEESGWFNENGQAELYRFPPIEPPMERDKSEDTGQLNQTAQAKPSPFRFVSQPSEPALNPPAEPAEDETQDAEAPAEQEEDASGESKPTRSGAGVVIIPISDSAWRAFPSSCLRRMLEFDSVKIEYERTYDRDPLESELDDARRLTLEDVVRLASMNSREYQTEKEILFRVALALSLERFAYQLKFSTTNNGTDVNYEHNRNAGVTVNSLAIPSRVQVDKMLITGGDLLARFANDVMLTFNGPQGFAADIGSELFFEVSQSVFQRDIRFESLTQAERDVIYAARDFVQFRKQLFVDLATDYYNLIRAYRQVEIDAQNYFSLVRAFDQGGREERAGFLPRFELDQIEQQMIAGRSRLLNTCNNLERALDSIKIRIGLPTETPINLDLEELDKITLGDEKAVTGELIRRGQKDLIAKIDTDDPNRGDILSATVVLIDRILELMLLDVGIDDIQAEEELPEEIEEFVDLRERLNVELARIGQQLAVTVLTETLAVETSTEFAIASRRRDVVDELLVLIQRQIALAQRLRAPAERLTELQRSFDALTERAAQLRDELGQVEQIEEQSDEDRTERAQLLQQETEEFAEQLDKLLDEIDDVERDDSLEATLAQARDILQAADQRVVTLQGGLVPIELEVDDGMLTALVQRFDLMNERGFLADDWRQIKLAADDLKSVLNLSASQSIRTPNNRNRPLRFSFRDSTTQLRLSFDAPLNRRAQRNSYRTTLIDYQAALRRLMSLEDNIKFSIRNDLRDLALGRDQYANDIASAALNFERTISTRIELRLGFSSIRTIDFLRAQNDYVSSLSSVVGRHIDYIIDRMQLFLDLETLTVDDNNFWAEFYDEEYQPTPRHQLPCYGQPPYGCLPPRVLYSPQIRQMEKIPTGCSYIHRDSSDSQEPEEANELERLPPVPPVDDAPSGESATPAY